MTLRLTLIILISFLYVGSFSQNPVDSLRQLLNSSDSRSEIYNLLAEATLEDSLELSRSYADSAFKYAIRESDLNEKGKAWFGMAEVFTYEYRMDSAIKYYELALEIFKKTGDNYYASYTLNNLGWIFKNYDEYEKAINYLLECTQYIDTAKHKDDLSHVLINIGNSYYKMGKYHTAIKHYKKAEKLARQIDYHMGMAISFNETGLSYKFLGEYDSAVHYYKKAMDLDKLMGDDKALAADYINLGALYAQWEDNSTALEYYRDGLEIYKEAGSERDLAITYSNLGVLARKTGDYDQALVYLREALSYDSILGIEEFFAIRYNNLGDVYVELNDFPTADKYFKKAVDINRKIENQYNLASSLVNLGRLNTKTANYGMAFKHFQEALNISKQIGASQMESQITEHLADLYEKTGQTAKALFYHKANRRLNDSLFTIKKQQQLADLRTVYEVEKKEKEIALLNKDNLLKETTIKGYRKSTIILLTGLGLILILLFFLIMQYSQKNKAYKKLVQKNLELTRAEKPVLNQMNARIEPVEIENQSEIKNYESLIRDLLDYLNKRKAFLNKDLNIKNVADHLKTNTHYLSKAINRAYNKSFPALINEIRIREAQKMLTDAEYANYTIEGIAREAGFNSKSAFNNAFKSFTGVTPSYYRRSADQQQDAVS